MTLAARARSGVLVGLLATAAGCTPDVRPPPRPLTVPRTSAWAQPSTTAPGFWVDCWRKSDELRAIDHKTHPDLDDRFACDVYAAGGAILRKGPFRMFDVTDAGALVAPHDPRALLRWRDVRGHRIDLGDGRILVEERVLRCDGASCSEVP